MSVTVPTLIITQHGRLRWVERAADYERYKHLRYCQSNKCLQCQELCADLDFVARNVKARLDSSIREYYREAVEADRWVQAGLFYEAIEKQYGKRDYVSFLQTKKGAILVLRVDGEDMHVLLSVLSNDMLESTVFRNAVTSDEFKAIFSKMKFQIRSKA